MPVAGVARVVVMHAAHLRLVRMVIMATVGVAVMRVAVACRRRAGRIAHRWRVDRCAVSVQLSWRRRGRSDTRMGLVVLSTVFHDLDSLCLECFVRSSLDLVTVARSRMQLCS